MEETKICSRCGPKPVSQFNSDRSKPDGLHTRCKECRRITETKAGRPQAQAQRETDLVIQVAKDRLAEMFPTAYAKLVLSERRRLHFFGDAEDNERLVS